MDKDLIAKLEYFRQRTEKDLDEIKIKLEKLWEFRTILLGGSMVVSSVIAFMVNMAFLYYEAHK
jgi:hypothetical protein